jgi:hypothetical protein
LTAPPIRTTASPVTTITITVTTTAVIARASLAAF